MGYVHSRNTYGIFANHRAPYVQLTQIIAIHFALKSGHGKMEQHGDPPPPPPPPPPPHTHTHTHTHTHAQHTRTIFIACEVFYRNWWKICIVWCTAMCRDCFARVVHEYTIIDINFTCGRAMGHLLWRSCRKQVALKGRALTFPMVMIYPNHIYSRHHKAFVPLCFLKKPIRKYIIFY